MQIKLVIKNFEEIEEEKFSVICRKSFSSWIIDYYFTEIFSNEIKLMNKSLQPKYIIGSYDMLMIYRVIQPSLTLMEFWELCKKKLKQIKHDCILENYNNYLNRCGLIDIIDLFYQCQIDSITKTIILSMKNIKNNLDRLFFEYLIELSSTSCGIYDVKTKLTTTETNENLLKLIDHEKTADEETTNSKNHLKHTLCTYLSLLLDTRNEHALTHCLLTPERLGIQRETIIELERLSKTESLTIYQILLSFLRRNELILNRISSSQHDLITNTDQSFNILEKSYNGIKEFFDFIEQLRMIIEENEHSKIESSVMFRKLLELIFKQLRKNRSFNQYDSVIKEIIEELCQCFQTTIPLMNCTSPIRSASSGATLAGRRFLRSIAYLCAKQTIDQPISIANNDISSDLLQNSSTLSSLVNDQVTEMKVVNYARFACHSKTIRKYRSLDLSIIHETSFESDSIIDHHPINSANKTQSKTIVKRQPLREIDVNSFNIEEREIEYEKNRSQYPTVFTLVSDGDKENLPVIIKKRSMISTKNEPPSKKHKKTNIKMPEVGQKMITSFFQSTS